MALDLEIFREYEINIIKDFRVDFEFEDGASDSSLEIEIEPAKVKESVIVGALKENVEKSCEVCKGKKATYHYGGTVCAGCKIFFSRAVRNSRSYVCVNGGGCSLVKRKKGTICQACRMKRCLKVGMQRENVGRLLQLRMNDGLAARIKEENSIVPKTEEPVPKTSIYTSTSLVSPYISQSSLLAQLVNLEKSKDNKMSLPYAENFKPMFLLNNSFRDSIEYPQKLCDPVPMDYVRTEFRKNPCENLKWFWFRNTTHFLEWVVSLDDFSSLENSIVEKTVKSRMVPVMTLVSFFGYAELDKPLLMNMTGDSTDKFIQSFFGEFSKITDFKFLKQSYFSIIEPMIKMDMKIDEMILLKLILLYENLPDHRRKYYNLLKCYLEENYSENQSLERLSQLMLIVNSVKLVSNYMDNWILLLCTADKYGMRDTLIEEFHLKP
ncbi:unnamed protein product [Caenorhabditis angaria]|uniref:Nuclear receptor domain-containing protein n=1 Tax=Caenorhabditis angaria TaxID=860376 RepID=A0A9P1N5W5_9PELO|nr:unnamed protein product [Caenorhabditis angaria]